MKFHTKQEDALYPPLIDVLTQLRTIRNFNAENYIQAKKIRINDYLHTSHLSSCVVAVSGGIDSAVVLSLIVAASKEKTSPIKKIVPITLPVFKSAYTTNQDDATYRAKEAIQQNGLEPIVCDLTSTYDELKKIVDSTLGSVGEPWAAGQLVSYLRTPALYYTTSLLTQQNTPGLVCGTTNRDEGAYLGFVGKASDGIVDIQVISDLHKSEVRKIAHKLCVPKSILDAIPTGDMFDGRVDEEVFGVSYDGVELFLLLKSLHNDGLRKKLLADLDINSKKQFERLSTKLEHLHQYNGHKYRVGSPAVHLDILESGIPGGWSYGYEKIDSQPKGEKYFVNSFSFSKDITHTLEQNIIIPPPISHPIQTGMASKFFHFSHILTTNEIQFLIYEASKHGYKPVGIDGYMKNFIASDKIGSYRASVFSPDLAEVIWNRISPYIDNPRIFTTEPCTDIDGTAIWRPIGVSPLFRYIRYDSGGLLVPHYDAPYIESEKQRTLMSLVIYIKNEGITGGATRFIKDPQLHTPFAEKNFSDWKRFATTDEILFSIEPIASQAICFDHRMLHDSSEIFGKGEKIIIRTDIVFARC